MPRMLHCCVILRQLFVHIIERSIIAGSSGDCSSIVESFDNRMWMRIFRRRCRERRNFVLVGLLRSLRFVIVAIRPRREHRAIKSSSILRERRERRAIVSLLILHRCHCERRNFVLVASVKIVSPSILHRRCRERRDLVLVTRRW